MRQAGTASRAETAQLTDLTALCKSSPQARNDATAVLAFLCTLHSLWHCHRSGFQVSAHQNVLGDLTGQLLAPQSSLVP